MAAVQGTGLRPDPPAPENPLIFDGRNLYDGERLARKGFHYYPIGRGDSCQLPIPQQQWVAHVAEQVVEA